MSEEHDVHREEKLEQEEDTDDELVNDLEWESKFALPPGMEKSQLGKLVRSFSGLEQLIAKGNDLTQVQIEKLKIHIRDLEEFRSKIMQMVELYLDDEEVSENLFSILDYINLGLSKDVKYLNIGVKKEEEEEGNILAEYQHAMGDLRISQQDDAAIQADLEFARLLQLQFEVESLNIEEEEEGGGMEQDNNLLFPGNINIDIRQLPAHVKSLTEDALVFRPIDGPTVEVESKLLQKVFTTTNLQFYTWKAKPLSFIQYVEVKITKKYKSFKEPFIIALWQNCEKSKLEFSSELLSQLSPFATCILNHPLQLQGSLIVSKTNKKPRSFFFHLNSFIY